MFFVVVDVVVGVMFFLIDFFCSKIMMVFCNMDIFYFFVILVIYVLVWSLCVMIIDCYIVIVKFLWYMILMLFCWVVLFVVFVWFIFFLLDFVLVVCDWFIGKCDLKNMSFIIGKMFMLEILLCFFLIMVIIYIIIIVRRYWC